MLSNFSITKTTIKMLTRVVLLTSVLPALRRRREEDMSLKLHNVTMTLKKKEKKKKKYK